MRKCLDALAIFFFKFQRRPVTRRQVLQKMRVDENRKYHAAIYVLEKMIHFVAVVDLLTAACQSDQRGFTCAGTFYPLQRHSSGFCFKHVHLTMHQLCSLILRHQIHRSRTPRPVRPHHRLHHPRRHPLPRRGREERCGSNKRSGNGKISAITFVHPWLASKDIGKEGFHGLAPKTETDRAPYRGPDSWHFVD